MQSVLHNRQFLTEHRCVITFFMELSNFTPSIALRGLQCGMMFKVRDNTGSDLDECRAEG